MWARLELARRGADDSSSGASEHRVGREADHRASGSTNHGGRREADDCTRRRPGSGHPGRHRQQADLHRMVATQLHARLAERRDRHLGRRRQGLRRSLSQRHITIAPPLRVTRHSFRHHKAITQVTVTLPSV